MNGKKRLATTVALATAAAPAAALAQYDGHAYDNDRASARSDRGVIASIAGTNVRLEDGRTIFLHSGTIINPRGITLQPGQRIFVTGSRGGHGAIDANEIDVNGAYRHERR